MVEGTAQDGSPSVLIFPEGVLTSGRSAADCPFPLRIVSLTPGCSSPYHHARLHAHIPDESDEADKSLLLHSICSLFCFVYYIKYIYIILLLILFCFVYYIQYIYIMLLLILNVIFPVCMCTGRRSCGTRSLFLASVCRCCRWPSPASRRGCSGTCFLSRSTQVRKRRSLHLFPLTLQVKTIIYQDRLGTNPRKTSFSIH